MRQRLVVRVMYREGCCSNTSSTVERQSNNNEERRRRMIKKNRKQPEEASEALSQTHDEATPDGGSQVLQPFSSLSSVYSTFNDHNNGALGTATH